MSATSHSRGNELTEAPFDRQLGQVPRRDARDQLRAVFRHRWLVLAVLLLVPAAAVATSFLKEKQYTASASLLFRDPGFDKAFLGVALSDTRQDPSRQAETNSRLLALESTRERAASALGVTTDEIERKVTVAPAGQSNLVVVEATDKSPRNAARLANVFATQFVRARSSADRAQILAARDSVLAELDRARKATDTTTQAVENLRRQAEQLKVFASLQTGGVELVSRATIPTSASSPNIVRSGVVGVLGGILLAFVAVFVAERLDWRLRDPEQAEETFGRPVVGLVPQAGRGQNPLLDSRFQESLRLLRVSLGYFGIGRDIKTLLFTSSSPSEGKSTVSLGFAFAAAQAQHSVLFIEADLRRGKVARTLGLPAGPGLAEVLTSQATLEEATVEVGPWGTDDDGARLSVLRAGHRVPNPGDLIESAHLQELLVLARREYDVVVIDAPPALAVFDTMAMLSHVDGTIVLARAGLSSRDQMRAVRRQFDHIGHVPTAVVVNGLRQSDRYGYYYGYGYGDAEPRQPPVPAAS